MRRRALIGAATKVTPIPTREFVDLGLPSGKLWATENVTGGSYTHERDGYLYYKYKNDSDELISQSAVAQWAYNDSTVSLPTKADFDELINNTNNGLVNVDGVTHAKFTSKSDSTKFITLPMIGTYWRTDFNADENGYWSSTALNVDRQYIINLSAVDGNLVADTSYVLSRVNYFPLRAVKTPPSPEPIPVEGDVQIFADPECTQYATGVTDKVYVRINVPWGFGGYWSIDQGAGHEINCGGPDEDYPNDLYYIQVYVDFGSADYNEPFTAGQVVELTSNDPYDITGRQTVFTRPS